MNFDDRIQQISEQLYSLNHPADLNHILSLSQELHGILSELESHLTHLDAELRKAEETESGIDKQVSENAGQDIDKINKGLLEFLKQCHRALKDEFASDETRMNDLGLNPKTFTQHLTDILTLCEKLKQWLEKALPFPALPLQDAEYLKSLEGTLELQEKAEELFLNQEEKHE